MAIFAYRGRDGAGDLVTGKIEADTKNAAAEALLSRSIIPIGFDEIIIKKPFSLNLFKPSVKIDELQIFTRQMYSLTKSGIPMLRAITGQAETATSKTMQEALKDIAEQLTSGKPLASAMKAYPEIFNLMYISMIHVGENTGRLEEIFLQLSIYIEREQETRKQIKSAMRYPMIVLGTIAVALVILNIFVIPQFAAMFTKFGSELPLPTKILISTSNFFINYWHLMLISIISLIFIVKHWIKTEDGNYKWDHFKIRMPIIGSIIFRATVSRYCRSLAMMLGSGVAMTQALSLVSEAVDNAYMRKRIQKMKLGVESGESMLRVSKNSELFTPLVLQMVSVGEETGQIEMLMIEASEYYDREVDYELKNLTAKIEPILIGFISVIVLILAMGIYLPIWSMMDLMKN